MYDDYQERYRERYNQSGTFFETEPDRNTNIYIHNEYGTRRTKTLIQHINGVSMIIIVLCMLFWTATITMASVPFGVLAVLGSLAMQAVFWLLVWLVYWLGYKLYWLMLAVGWLMLTAFGMASMTAFMQFASANGLIVR